MKLWQKVFQRVTHCLICATDRRFKNETIAVGDSLNDLTMFEFASLPIASGNASKKIKEITKNVACSNNEPIVKYILENFIK